MRQGTAKKIQPSILVLEDDRNLAEALTDYFEDEGWEVTSASRALEARKHLSARSFDLVLVDYLLPGEDGLSVFDEIQDRSPSTKVMMMTGVQDMEVASLAFRKGASDLISKPFEINELADRVGRLLDQKQESESRSSKRKPNNMVGNSAPMRKVFHLIDLVAARNSSVLIKGESGTGKELVARAIHDTSNRAKQAFVAINCGAIPEHLLEDELFGHVRGAFTDAKESRVGKFEMANHGTLFLDEIGTMPAPLQIKLLRVLEERQIEKLGSNRTLKVDVRIIAATNAELRERIEEGSFRDDLFYRLNVVPIQLPPLRDRPKDIPLLVQHFLKLFTKCEGLETKTIPETLMERLSSYAWPGNIRELKNVLELACVLSADRTSLEPEDFPSLDEIAPADSRTPTLRSYLQLPEEGVDLNEVVSELEKNLICQSLRRTGGNKGKAARLLFLKRTTLVEKLRRMNLLEEFTA